ncbi:CHASE2 domain-containing protein [Kamptonema formosum]|uniref:CHASE2 domain-containing protein n=1 Tax=Kamptonema formosum TaxID=331992 RepID=UPI000344E577|nr:adenylate/guanylate cyclase domain-containing protein [Oscillatoria sp. PCC 10802]
MRAKLRQGIWEWRGILIAAPAAAGLTIALRLAGLLQLLEWAALDQFFRLRPPEPADARIVIVAIDEPDITKAGQWPIPDAVLAQLLEKLKQQQPRAIGLDVYRDLPVPPGHQELVKVFQSSPNIIGIEKVVGDIYGAAVSPPPELLRRNQVSAADLVLDADGKVRRGLLSVRAKNGKTVLGLGAQLALMYLEAEGIKPAQTPDKSVKLGKAVFVRFKGEDGGYVRADAGGYQLLLNFRGRRKSFPTVSMTDVLENRIPPDLMRDRIVLIGSTAPSLNDLFLTPYSSSLLAVPVRMPGVEIHAHIASQILSAALDSRPLLNVWDEPAEWLWIFFWSCAGATLGWVSKVSLRTVYILLLACSSMISAAYFLFLNGWWVPVVPPALALAGAAIAIVSYIAQQEHQDRQTVMNLFGRHVTPKIADQIWRERNQFLQQGKLVGQKMTATVLFTDLQGFSTIAENTDPATLMSLLNEYMSAMAVAVLDCDGVIDKFIGDAIMAVFGVPIPRMTEEEISADAIAAVCCAVAMGKKLRSLNDQWRLQGRPKLTMRVGIATGTVVAGSLGCTQRVDYTIIGDTVNIASRLESYDKSLEGGICRILISEGTCQYLGGKFPRKFIGSLQLKGRENPENVYLVPLD